jgi:hypothetical protein
MIIIMPVTQLQQYIVTGSAAEARFLPETVPGRDWSQETHEKTSCSVTESTSEALWASRHIQTQTHLLHGHGVRVRDRDRGRDG